MKRALLTFRPDSIKIFSMIVTMPKTSIFWPNYAIVMLLNNPGHSVKDMQYYCIDDLYMHFK